MKGRKQLTDFGWQDSPDTVDSLLDELFTYLDVEDGFLMVNVGGVEAPGQIIDEEVLRIFQALKELRNTYEEIG